MSKHQWYNLRCFISVNQSNWPRNQDLSFTSHTLYSRRFCIIKIARQWFLDDLAPRNNGIYSVILEANYSLLAGNICLSLSFLHRRLDYTICTANYNLATLSWTLDALFPPVFTSNFLCLSCLPRTQYAHRRPKRSKARCQ